MMNNFVKNKIAVFVAVAVCFAAPFSASAAGQDRYGSTQAEAAYNLGLSKNNFIGKKREKDNKEKPQIQKTQIKNKKINNLNEINKVTVISPKAFKCECGKIFSTEENQRLHYINIHLHEKPYNCSFCGEGFSHRNGKIYHERMCHTFIFPYVCKKKNCQKSFASHSALNYHMKTKH